MAIEYSSFENVRDLIRDIDKIYENQISRPNRIWCKIIKSEKLSVKLKN